MGLKDYKNSYQRPIYWTWEDQVSCNLYHVTYVLTKPTEHARLWRYFESLKNFLKKWRKFVFQTSGLKYVDTIIIIIYEKKIKKMFFYKSDHNTIGIVSTR